jgi:hypothetical protein
MSLTFASGSRTDLPKTAMPDSPFDARPHRTGVIIVTLPAALMLVLIFSLIIHMHISLGRWPSITEEGFPRELIVHARIVSNCFYVLFFSFLFLPVPIFITLLVEKWRRFTVYTALYAVSLLLGLALFRLGAPRGFLDWWWD